MSLMCLGSQVSTALTPKEREVVRLLAEGRTAKEISALTDRHRSTVYEHLGNIRARLGVRTDAEIGVYAVCAGLIQCQSQNP
jgi:DNA-binding CsgD family transcriptional regulator